MSGTPEILSSVNGSNIWSTILTAGLGIMSYVAKVLYDGMKANADANVKLELKVAENYATKPTVMALFQEATIQTKEAVARVEKSIDAANASVGKLEGKMDRFADSLGTMQTNIMKELSNKT